MGRLMLTLFLYVFWLLLSAKTDAVTLIVGGVAALVVGGLWGGRLRCNPAKALDPRRWFWGLVFGVVFVWEMAKANFDVAYRVLHPRRPLSPGILRVTSRCQSPLGRVFLANAITLTPGTLTVDLHGETLYVHCIRIKTQALDAQRDRIVRRFDRLLTKIFD